MSNQIELRDYKVEWIDSTKRLIDVSNEWQKKPFLAVDTEFERRTTFFAKLALVQIFDGESIYLIDPLKLQCPSELRTVLESPNVVKIFHSCKEDIEVLYTSWNCRLSGLFDTQVAYAFISSELSIGYAKLVENFYDIPVDKKETTSDWLKRPLTDKQKTYAAKDVLYLIELYLQLVEKLKQTQSSNLFSEECRELCLNAITSVEELPSYREAKDVWRLNETQLGLFKLLFYWRESVARENDRTRNHIFKDQELVELAIIAPQNINQIKNLKSIHPRSIRLYSESLLNIVQDWRSNGSVKEAIVLNPRDVKGLKEKSSDIELIVTKIAKEQQLNPTFLLSKRVIRKTALAIITGQSKPLQWRGWRQTLLKEYITD